MLQDVPFPCERHKNTVDYNVLAPGTHQKKDRQKLPKMSSKKHVVLVSSVFFTTPDPENTARVKEFGGGVGGRPQPTGS